MKVCVIGTRGFPFIEGGVEKHCESLYPLLAENAEIVCFRRQSYVKKNANYRNITFIDLPSTRIKGLEALMHSFLAVLCAIAQRADVVHFHNIGPALFAPLVKLFSVPVLLTYHSPNYEHQKWGRFAKKFLLFSEHVALKFSDKIIFVNDYQMRKYPQYIQEKSVYIPNGINLPRTTQSYDKLSKYDLQPGKYVLSVGRITPEKGFHTLIRAFKELNRNDYKLVIAGGVEFESGYMKELQILSKDLPVVFTGYVFGDMLAQLYSNAALFVLASENEGFPLVLLEAMSYQKDVLVSDIPATRLIALDEADYFPSGNCEMLYEAMQNKLRVLQKREYDLTGYNWQKIAEQTESVLRSMAVQN